MFRFTIRELVLLTLVVGLAAAYVIQRRQLEVARRAIYDVQQLVTLLDEKGYRVMWDHELGTMGAIATDPDLPRATEPRRRTEYACPPQWPYRKPVSQ